jgi:hypothetical protein
VASFGGEARSAACAKSGCNRHSSSAPPTNRSQPSDVNRNHHSDRRPCAHRPSEGSEDQDQTYNSSSDPRPRNDAHDVTITLRALTNRYGTPPKVKVGTPSSDSEEIVRTIRAADGWSVTIVDPTRSRSSNQPTRQTSAILVIAIDAKCAALDHRPSEGNQQQRY